jgi:DNA polymerase-3 subunit gamma/tau
MDIVEIDGASNRGIDEIRDLREALRYLPSRGRYKIYIIDEVHMLTKEAFNALLKTLEEPPPHVVFIFATTELDKIPYTILSRCQRFEFKRVSLSGIVSHLDHIVQREGLSISHASLLRVAKAAEGSMRDAQSLLDQVVAYCGTEVNDAEVGYLLGSVGSETLARCLSALFQQDAETVLHTADELQADGHEATAILRALQEGLRHLIVLKTTADPGELIPLSEADLETLRPVAEMASVEEIYGHFQVLSQAEQSLRSASNPFLVLEMALVRVARIGRVQPLERILETLQHLQQGIPAPAPETARSQSSESLPKGTVHASEPPSLRSVQQVEAEPAVATMPTAEPIEVMRGAATDFWQALQDYVMDRRPSIGSLLQPGQVVSHNETVLVIGFAKENSFNRTSLMDRDNLDVVREAAETVGGYPVQVKIVALDGSQAQPGQDDAVGVVSAQQAGDLARADLQQQKRESIQAVLDIFDGTIIT